MKSVIRWWKKYDLVAPHLVVWRLFWSVPILVVLGILWVLTVCVTCRFRNAGNAIQGYLEDVRFPR